MQISTMTYRVKFYYLLESKTNYNKKMEKHLYSEKKKKARKGHGIPRKIIMESDKIQMPIYLHL